MSSAVKKILESFDQLSDREKKECTDAILRRVAEFSWPPLTDDELTQIAGQQFKALSRAEKKNEKPKSRRSVAG